MLDQDIYPAIGATVANVLLLPKDDIDPTTQLDVDLGADSLDILEILFRLESHFGIEINLPVREAAFVEKIAHYLKENLPQNTLASSELVIE
jgi:acyl carrier protein